MKNEEASGEIVQFGKLILKYMCVCVCVIYIYMLYIAEQS